VNDGPPFAGRRPRRPVDGRTAPAAAKADDGLLSLRHDLTSVPPRDSWLFAAETRFDDLLDGATAGTLPSFIDPHDTTGKRRLPEDIARIEAEWNALLAAPTVR